MGFESCFVNGHINAKGGAEVYLWKKGKRTISELEFVQSTAV
jgi:hypothetical protein